MRILIRGARGACAAHLFLFFHRGGMVAKRAEVFRQYTDLTYYFDRKDVVYAPLAQYHTNDRAIEQYHGDEDERRDFELAHMYIVRRHARQMHRRLIRSCLADRFADIHPDLSADPRAATAIERTLARSRIGDVRGHAPRASTIALHFGDDEEESGEPATWVTGEYMWHLFGTPKAQRIGVLTAESVCRVIALHVLGLLKWKRRANDTTGANLVCEHFRRTCRTHPESAAVSARLAALVEPDHIVDHLIDIYGDALVRLLGKDWERNLRMVAELERL